MPAKKSLAEEFSEPPRNRLKKDACNVGEAVRSHKEGEVIGRVVADLRYSAPHIAAVLASHGIQVSASSVRNHRRGECACAGRGV